jgi:polyhydroxyalkanoate synthase
VPLLGDEVRFTLGASGHIAGVINPPTKRKRSHWVHPAGDLPQQAEAWLSGATEQAGSWWPDWAEWLKALSGKQIAAPKSAGNRRYKAVEPAPGSYVKARV